MSLYSCKDVVIAQGTPLKCHFRLNPDDPTSTCNKETYFGLLLQYSVVPLCQEHLLPRMRRRSIIPLYKHLGDVMYCFSRMYMTKLFGKEQRSWSELSHEDREKLPVDVVNSIKSQVEQDVSYCVEPLSDLVETLAVCNARATVVAMGGGEYLKQMQEAAEKKGISNVLT